MAITGYILYLNRGGMIIFIIPLIILILLLFSENLISKKMNTIEKLKILSEDSRYDMACACGSGNDDRRKRGLVMVRRIIFF